MKEGQCMSGQNSETCFLCDKPPMVAGCFIPNDSRLWGDDGVKSFWYKLCDSHFNNGHPPVNDIEQKLLMALPGGTEH